MANQSKTDSIFKPILYLVGLGILGVFIYLILSGNELSENKWLTFLAGITVLICTRLSDIIKFNVGKDGVSAEMERAVREAQATVAQLHDMAELFATISVQQIVGSGRWSSTTPRVQREMIEKIEHVLTTIDMPKAKIDAVLSQQEPFDDFDYFDFVTKDAQQRTSDPIRAAWSAFFTPYFDKGIGHRPTIEQTEKFLQDNDLITPDVEERLKDWKYYRQHKRHRRRDLWEARYQPVPVEVNTLPGT